MVRQWHRLSRVEPQICAAELGLPTRIRRGGKGPELIITDPVLGDFAIDERFTLELLELLFPPEMRQRLPNGGWRKVSLRILIALLRCGLIRIAEES